MDLTLSPCSFKTYNKNKKRNSTHINFNGPNENLDKKKLIISTPNKRFKNKPVFNAKDKLGEPVFVKQISKNGDEILKISKTLSDLTNFVKYIDNYEASTSDGKTKLLHIVYERVDLNLDDFLKEKGSGHHFKSILFQIYHGLFEAQVKYLFLHGDFHPKNIGLQKVNNKQPLQYKIDDQNYQVDGTYLVKILDFGNSSFGEKLNTTKDVERLRFYLNSGVKFDNKEDKTNFRLLKKKMSTLSPKDLLKQPFFNSFKHSDILPLEKPCSEIVTIGKKDYYVITKNENGIKIKKHYRVLLSGNHSFRDYI